MHHFLFILQRRERLRMLMKRLVLLLFLLFAATCITAVDKLVFYTQDFPPFSFKFGGQISGPYVDIIKLVCKEIGVEAEFGLYEWGDAQEKAKKGEAHALFVMGKNKSRESWIYFSHAVNETEYGLFVKEDDNLQYTNPKQLMDYKIAVYGPSNTEKNLRKIAELEKSIKVDVYPEDETAFQKLVLGDAQAVFSNVDVGNQLVHRLKLNTVRYAGHYKKLNYYIGFLKDNIDKATFDKFNNKLKELKDSGEIKKILDMYNLKQAN